MQLYNLPFFDVARNLYINRYYKNYDAELVAKLKDLHNDERCFLVGTGPSLTPEQLKMISEEVVFGTNTAYKIGYNFDYYCVSDRNVWRDNKEKILKQNTQLLLSGHAGRDFLVNKDKYRKITNTAPIVFKDLGDIKRNGWQDKDLTHGTYWGNSIMIDCCLQVAYWMGFSEVYLLGCDCNYKDKHHFDGEKYDFQADIPAYYDQHWEKVFKAHEIIKEEFEKAEKKIYNATPNSSLEVYERVKLEDII